MNTGGGAGGLNTTPTSKKCLKSLPLTCRNKKKVILWPTVEICIQPKSNFSKNFYLIFHFKISGKVLVNCLMGMSRSSTCVLAYLMMRQNMTAVEALTEVRRHREVRPNDGFLRQLADLDNKLRRERGQLS